MSTTLWNELVAMALVGTQRRVPQLPASDGVLGHVFERLSDTEPERALLAASAAASLYARCGHAPATDERVLPTPCDLEDWLRCSPRSGAHLSRMLEREYEYGQLLPEWMAAAIKVQKRVPEEFLPSLLNIGLRHKKWRAQIVEVIGKRGRWLAAQNPAWEYAAVSEDGWMTGSTSARTWLLNKLRAENPTQARELLATTWAEETAHSRAEFLSEFYTRLSQEDEPFLEAALDDRSTKVREKAAQLLLRIPDSALSLRMIARARSLLTLKPGKKPRLDVTLPEACDETMIRDGIAPEPPKGKQGIGARAYWLSEIMGAIPPSQWLEGISLTAAELVNIVGKHEWKDVLPEALALAAYRHADADVTEALFAAGFNHVVLNWGLMGVLSPERREALILETLKKDKSLLHPGHPAMQYLNILGVVEHVCSPALSRAVLAAIRRTLDKGGVDTAQALASTLEWLARRLDPLVAHEAAAALSLKDAPVGWEAAAKKMVSILEFRQSMLKELMQ